MSNPAQAVTIIASHTFIKGEVHITGPASISGRIEGALTAEDQVEITAEGYIEGDVHGAVIEVNGSIKGNILATRSCRLGPTAKAAGELRAANLSIAEGACFVGQVCVGAASQNEQPAAPESVVKRLESLAADSRELAETAAGAASPAGAGIRVNTETVQKTLTRTPQIIKARV